MKGCGTGMTGRFGLTVLMSSPWACCLSKKKQINRVNDNIRHLISQIYISIDYLPSGLLHDCLHAWVSHRIDLLVSEVAEPAAQLVGWESLVVCATGHDEATAHLADPLDLWASMHGL